MRVKRRWPPVPLRAICHALVRRNTSPWPTQVKDFGSEDGQAPKDQGAGAAPATPAVPAPAVIPVPGPAKATIKPLEKPEDEQYTVGAGSGRIRKKGRRWESPGMGGPGMAARGSGARGRLVSPALVRGQRSGDRQSTGLVVFTDR